MAELTTQRGKRVLFIEPVTPGPLSPFAELLATRGDEVVVLSGQINRAMALPVGARLIAYPLATTPPPFGDAYLADMERAVELATRVAKGAAKLKGADWEPELICGLDDGSAIFLAEIFPDCPQLMHIDRFVGRQTNPAQTRSEAETALAGRLTNTVRLFTTVHAHWSLCTSPVHRASYPAFLQGRLSVLAPAVDTSYFTPLETSNPAGVALAGELPDAVASWYGSRPPAPLVTFLARTEAGYRNALVIAGELVAVGTAATVLLATAQGPEGPRPCGPNGEETFLVRPGPGDRRRLARSSALVVQTDLDDGWPMAMVEAMACGATVLALASPTTASLLEHAKTGYLSSPTDPVAMANLVTWALAHRSELGAVRGNARAAVQRFGLKETTETYRRLVDWLISGGAGPIRPATFMGT